MTGLMQQALFMHKLYNSSGGRSRLALATSGTNALAAHTLANRKVPGLVMPPSENIQFMHYNF